MCGYRTSEPGKRHVGGHCVSQQVVGQDGIGQLQEALEQGPGLRVGIREITAGKALQQHIQLLHAATAVPKQTPRLRIHQN